MSPPFDWLRTSPAILAGADIDNTTSLKFTINTFFSRMVSVTFNFKRSRDANQEWAIFVYVNNMAVSFRQNSSSQLFWSVLKSKIGNLFCKHLLLVLLGDNCLLTQRSLSNLAGISGCNL